MMAGLITKIVKMKSFKSRTPASVQQVEEAEKTLGLKFAREYKEYLLRFGCASIYGHELTGICESARLDVVQLTQEIRAFDANIPSDWYVIEETNIDGGVIWQDGEGKVFLKYPCQTAEFVAGSIEEYLRE